MPPQCHPISKLQDKEPTQKHKTLKITNDFKGLNGAPEETRTPNLLIRSQMLYPIELRAHDNIL